MKIPLAERLFIKNQRLERKMVIGDVDVIATEKREKEKRKQMEDKRIKPRECDRYGISDRAAASFASAVLQDIGIVNEGETSHVVDRNKIRRLRKKLQNAISESTKLTVSWSLLTGLYFDGRKDNTKVLINEDTKYYPNTQKEEHYTLVNEPNSVYIGYVTAAIGGAKDIKESILNFFVSNNMQLNGLTVIGCDGTNVNTGHKRGFIRLMELASIDHYNGEFVCFKQRSFLSVIY
ncbi:hypothetical protein AVEN_120941-1 [Araneus ventricosus]|uniref:DUF4371 domain-containing protein n=1 Tax=Araneus ventricosus TaxID=182803 RepID=A0A4Y2EDY7_ARAVE|nr:hypothetical protein AVEN_120941-1 [Araneus ventricosus]